MTKKSFVLKCISPVYYHLGLLCTPLFEFKNKLLDAIVLRTFPQPEEAIPLVHISVLLYFSNQWYHGVAFFLLMQVFFFNLGCLNLATAFMEHSYKQNLQSDAGPSFGSGYTLLGNF